MKLNIHIDLYTGFTTPTAKTLLNDDADWLLHSLPLPGVDVCICFHGQG